MDEIVFRTLAEHRRALDKGEYSSAELLACYLDRIAQIDPQIGAFLTLNTDSARELAKLSDLRRKNGERVSILDGIPFGVKDNLCTRGIRTTCASRMLEHYVPPYDATVVSQMYAQGGVLLGKLNMDEFGMGSSTEHSALGVTRNPHDQTRVPGGSSGGPAAAVAAGEVPFALASDTGGSVRQPAAFCGVLGLKPTYGVLSRYGLVAFASSLDCVGVMTRSAEDCALVFSALLGKDSHDATSIEHGGLGSWSQIQLSGVRLGVSDTDFGSMEARQTVETVRSKLSQWGMATAMASLPLPEQALAAYYVISSAEASSNLSRFDGVRFGHRSTQAANLTQMYDNSRFEGLGDEVKRRILFGTYVLSVGNRDAFYLRACYVREKIKREMQKVFENCDVLLLPTAPTTAFSFGEKHSPSQMYASDLCTVYANLSGFPALSVPVGKDQHGLPRAVQLIAPPMREDLLLRVAKALEEDRK